MNTLIQVTIMKLKVDLECEKCYKKVKKLLGKYPREFITLASSFFMLCTLYILESEL